MFCVLLFPNVLFVSPVRIFLLDGTKKYKVSLQYKTPLKKYKTPVNNIRTWRFWSKSREKGSGDGEESGGRV